MSRIDFNLRSSFSARGLFYLLLALYFLLMLVLPTTFQYYRGGLLAVLVLVGGIAALKRWAVTPDVFLIWAATLSAGLFFIFWGYLNHAPGALRVSTVHLLWPIVYMLLVGLATPKLVTYLNRVIVLGVAVTAGMALFLLGGALAGKGPLVAQWLAFQGAGVGIYDGYVELTAYNLTTVIYGLPFLMAALVFDRNGEWLRHRKAGWLLLALVLLVSLASGRRAFWLLSLATPVIVAGLSVAASRRLPWKPIAVVAVAGALVLAMGAWLADISLAKVGAEFASAFSGAERNSSLRYQQWQAMVQAFQASPWIGHGLGAALDSVTRSEEMPWAYELYYGALLFQIGLSGLLVYGMAIAWIFIAGIRLARRDREAAPVILPLLAGLAGFLLVNATNPYLAKFDYLWTIFLPVAVINAYRIHHRKRSSSLLKGDIVNVKSGHRHC
jgi:O-antigen ligase